MANIKGKQLMVTTTVQTTGTSRTFRTIAYATSHTLHIGSNLDDVGTKDDNDLYVNQEVTSQNWSITTENLIAYNPYDQGAPTYEHLLAQVKTGGTVDVYFVSMPGAMGEERQGESWTASGNTPNQSTILTGMASITSLELNAGNRENVSYTATFTGYGKPNIASVTSLNAEVEEGINTLSAKKSKKSETTETAES